MTEATRELPDLPERGNDGLLDFRNGRNTDRLVFFSDAVFAIAMTLLALDIRLPEMPPDRLGSGLVGLFGKAMAYLVSFAVIGSNWSAHHTGFRVIERYDRLLVTLNLWLLFVVALVPFTSSVISGNVPSFLSVAVYSGSLSAMWWLQLALWTHARRAGLMSAVVTDADYRHVRTTLSSSAVMFLVAIALAAVIEPWMAMMSWILVPVVIRLRRRLHGRQTPP